MMTDGKKNEESAGEQEEVLKAVQAFEQILEVMPDDLASLETLSLAYEQLGDADKAAGYLQRLAEVLLSSGDVSGARDLLPRLSAHAEGRPALQPVVRRIETSAITPAAEPDRPVESKHSEDSVRRAFSIEAALDFAWQLKEDDLLSQDEYASCVQNLTELSVAEGMVTVSVFHVLEHMGFKGIDKALNHAAKKYGTPVIALSSFDIPADAARMLPVDFMVRRGVLVFSLLGSEALCATVNPHESDLRGDVEALIGRPCHLYLARPSDFDGAIGRVTDVTT